MELTRERKISSLKKKTLCTVLGVACAVALPEIFHLIGSISGMGIQTGEFFLPMHIPVIIVSMLGGWQVGLIVGALSPIASFLISGMPTFVMLPFMVVELAAYGVTAGLLKKTRLNSACSLAITQVVGRLLRAAAIAIAIYGFNFTSLLPESMYMNVVKGLFGICLQFAVIPVIVNKLKRKIEE